MVLLSGLILATAFTVGCGKILKKHSLIFYIVSAVLSVFTVILSFVETRNLPMWVNSYVLSLLTKSGFASSLWIIVMWAGALKNGSKAIKKVMPIRGELSIIAAILTLGHNINYGRTYFVRLFTNPQSIPANYLIAAVISLVMMLIMIPLTVISFPAIRKKMNVKRWKSVQRFAYLFYGLMYAHILLLYIPMAQRGNNIEASFNILLYSIIFITYLGCRIRKYFIVKKKVVPNARLNAVTAVVVFAMVFGASAFAVPMHKNSNSADLNTDTKANISATKKAAETTLPDVTEKASENSIEKSTQKSSESSTQPTKNNSSQKESKNIEETAVNENADNKEDNQDNEKSEAQENAENIDTPSNENINTNSDNSSADSDTEIQKPLAAAKPQPNYVYNNGTYTAKAYGYDGDVEITITIENDVITSISGTSEESDLWYFDNAKSKVFNEIINSQQTDVDACSGATFSSNAIMSAVQSALNSAKK